jgi:hypothetical protein
VSRETLLNGVQSTHDTIIILLLLLVVVLNRTQFPQRASKSPPVKCSISTGDRITATHQHVEPQAVLVSETQQH